MLALKMLAGPQVGNEFILQEGRNVFGRSESAQHQISHKSVSREHFEIVLEGNELRLKDLNSRNGTFVNGVKVKEHALKIQDMISINEVILQVIPATAKQSAMVGGATAERQSDPEPAPQAADQRQAKPAPEAPQPQSSGLPAIDGANAMWSEESPAPFSQESEEGQPESASEQKKTFVTLAHDYFENVVMPGVYKLGEVAEFKWVLGSFVLFFIFFVTILSTIPMAQIAQERIEKESRLRVFDIASQLARRYQSALQQNLAQTFEIHEDQKQGVIDALIISADDGSILAPPSSFGTTRDLPFIHSARRVETASVEIVSSGELGAAIPIRRLNPNTGDYGVYAYSVVLYDMGSRTLQFEDIVRLFVQVLAIAILLGLILYVFMYRLIEHPIRSLNVELDRALKEGSSEAVVKFRYPIFQQLLMNVNSALSRIDHAQSHDADHVPTVDPSAEAENLVRVLNVAALVVDGQHTILAINADCEDLIGTNAEMLLQQPVAEIPDQALQLNLVDLIQQAEQSSGGMVSSELEFGGVSYTIEAAPIHSMSAIKYIIITFKSSIIEGGF